MVRKRASRAASQSGDTSPGAEPTPQNGCEKKMKVLDIPDVNAKVNFVWMNVAQQHGMCDEDLAEVVAQVHPDLIFEEVDAPENFEEWSAPCQTAQPVFVPPEVVSYVTAEIDEMKAHLEEYHAAREANAGDAFAAGYFESMESVLAEEIAKKEAVFQNVTIPRWLLKGVAEKIIECNCCTTTLGKPAAVKVLFFGKAEHQEGLSVAMTESGAEVVVAATKTVEVPA
ncbi:MAG TPA: hypothetical protein VKK79_22490 [Candidatus Lokiarchaeia archaeon]|nr:hypothetical protein [Candidatus Lokiarchaeia archaeon]